MDKIDLTWQGGKHAFALPIGPMRAVQQACNAGPSFVLMRLSSGQWEVDDVIAPIRFGLEGAGMAATDARDLVDRFVEADHLGRHVPTAMAILQYAIFGVDDEDDPVGE